MRSSVRARHRRLPRSSSCASTRPSRSAAYTARCVTAGCRRSQALSIPSPIPADQTRSTLNSRSKSGSGFGSMAFGLLLHPASTRAAAASRARLLRFDLRFTNAYTFALLGPSGLSVSGCRGDVFQFHAHPLAGAVAGRQFFDGAVVGGARLVRAARQTQRIATHFSRLACPGFRETAVQLLERSVG